VIQDRNFCLSLARNDRLGTFSGLADVSFGDVMASTGAIESDVANCWLLAASVGSNSEGDLPAMPSW
jgi:hypothetical protein